MFETDEDRADERRRVAVVLLAIIVLGIIAAATYITIVTFHPLANVRACAQRGFQGGQIVGTRTMCFNDCKDNQLAHCKQMTALP